MASLPRMPLCTVICSEGYQLPPSTLDRSAMWPLLLASETRLCLSICSFKANPALVHFYNLYCQNYYIADRKQQKRVSGFVFYCLTISLNDWLKEWTNKTDELIWDQGVVITEAQSTYDHHLCLWVAGCCPFWSIWACYCAYLHKWNS